MPTFDDFNFGDDSGAVDTDPVPDNDNLDSNQSTPTDGIQDDVANYPEPGQDDTFEGGDPTIMDVQGNPNEPGAQSDHIPPEALLRQLVASSYERDRIARRFDEATAPIPPPLGPPADKPRKPSPSVKRRLAAELFYRLSDSEQEELQSANTIYDLSFREIVELAQGMPEAYVSDEELKAVWGEYNETGQWWRPKQLTRAQARKETKKLWGIGARDIIGRRPLIPEDALTDTATDDVIEDTNAAEEVQFGYLLDSVAAIMLVPDAIIDSLFDDASMVALIEEFNNSDASKGWIEGLDDWANPVDNPSGIGEVFDQLLISGHDAFMAVDNSQDIDGLIANDFLSLDQYDDMMDIRDYVGDITLNSDIIEFQNMGQNVLEDFDGVL